MAAGWRYTSYAIDTVLLVAGISLAISWRLSPLEQPWLASKLILLLAYIVLGSFALKRGRTAGVRGTCYLLALTLYLWMIGVALRHDPLSWLA